MDEPTPTTTPEEEEAFNLVLTKKGCKEDEDLNVSPHQSEWTFTQSESRRHISPFPLPVTFINLACIAYENHGKNETYLSRLLRRLRLRDPPPNEPEAPAELAGVPEGFELLAKAFGMSFGNGYYGVAYINRETNQIIVSHRGTKLSNLGALKTDGGSILLGIHTAQVPSAITFAHTVAEFALKHNCQLFFTGHSLGAWLAQITCFSTKYLTPNGSGHFVRKPPGEWDDLHPYTVAFDSPGALQFLLKMKDDLLLRNEPQYQIQVNVACLPVEVYQFHTKLINTVNTQIGTVYLVDLENNKMDYSYVWKPTVLGTQFQINKPLATHSIQPVAHMMTENREESETKVVRSRVIDWRGETWWNEGRSVAVELHKFAEYFLTRKELDLLKELCEKEVGGGGCYEGLFSEDEEVANRLLECCKRGGVFVDGHVRLGEKLDRREVIPQVRQFAQALKKKVIWWNPTKPPVPENFIVRSVAETRHFRSGWLPSSVPQKRLEEMDEPLVLVVDPPGMGKSSEMSYLERRLRQKVSSNRIILRVNLNKVQMALSMLSSGESASSVLLKLAPFLPKEIFETAGVHVFVLLDALDEVCPTHQTTMINLLRLLNSMRRLSVFLTTRPHLRGVLEKEFNLESWSLPPLTVGQQDEYMKSVLNKSSEEISGIRWELTESVSNLLGIPLMLSMFVDVIQSGGDFAGEALNTFELYEKFMKEKHKLYMVEKRGAKEVENYTQNDLKNILETCLPHYYRSALYHLVVDEGDWERVYRECGGIVAQEEPSGVTRLNLVSLGLLVEDSEDRRLVFKYLSFAEFFYARLLTVEDSLPQGARDIVFGFIYAGSDVLENVEAFVAASLRSKTPPPTTLPAPLLLSLSPNWILCTEDFDDRASMIRGFLDSSHLFPLLVREVLLTCVSGDADDLREVLKGFIYYDNMDEIRKLWLWMSENREWTRGELLKMNQVGTTPTPTYPLGVARLMVAIYLHFEEQKILSEEEVGVAMDSCDRRLVNIVAGSKIEGISGRSKWEWVEGQLSGGRSKLREFFLHMDAEDLYLMFGTMENAWKLVTILSEEQISARLTNEETRLSDICGRSPLEVVVVLGEEFLPPKQLAQFRGKFGEEQGKTVFEMEEGGCGFAVKWLWGELVGEVRRGDETGPVTVALREALRRMRMDRARKLLIQLEGEVLRRRRRCRRGQQEQNEEEAVVVGGVLVEWVAKSLQWPEQLNISSLEPLPFVLRYWRRVDPTQLKTSLKSSFSIVDLKFDSQVKAALRSLVIASSPRSRDPAVFSVLSDFLRANLSSIDRQGQSLVGVFVDATREQIAEAACPHSLVSEVSVGGVLLKLLPRHQQQPEGTWEIIACDVIEKTPCCDLPAALDQLRQQMEGQTEGVGLLKEVLTSYDVLKGWRGPFNLCRVTRLLAFYFSVFGLNLQWTWTIWLLLENLPVEIATALKTEPTWAHLLPQFQEILRKHLQQSEVVSVIAVAESFSYETDAEWESLLPLIDGEALLPGKLIRTKRIPSSVAAPLLRTLIRLYGVEWTKQRLTPDLWNSIHSRPEDPSDSVGSLGSLLHSAITLGVLEEVKKRAWPAVVKWRNAEGKSAVDVAKDQWEEESHPIRVHLEQLTCHQSQSQGTTTRKRNFDASSSSFPAPPSTKSGRLSDCTASTPVVTETSFDIMEN